MEVENIESCKTITCQDYQLQELFEIQEFSTDFEVHLTKADLLVMLFAGLSGTLSSVALKNFFSEIHDHFGKKITLKGGHSGEIIDIVPGSCQPGGFGHRWKFGHDLLNPFEIPWDDYLKLAEDSGTKLPLHLKAVYFWLRHLFQDTFSTEGLPIPGNSVLRLFCNFSKPQTREFLQVFGTIKSRDIVGSGVVGIILNAYLEISQRKLNELEKSYLFFGANTLAFFMGLAMPASYKSANLQLIPGMVHYYRKIYILQKHAENCLNERQIVLDNNKKIIEANKEKLDLCIAENFKKLQQIDIDRNNYDIQCIFESYNKILKLQEVAL